MQFKISKDEDRRVTVVEFSWTDAETDGLEFNKIEQDVLALPVNMASDASMVVSMIAKALEQADAQAKRVMN